MTVGSSYDVRGPRNAESRFWDAADQESTEIDEVLAQIRKTCTELAQNCGLWRLRGLGKIGTSEQLPDAQKKEEARAAARQHLRRRKMDKLRAELVLDHHKSRLSRLARNKRRISDNPLTRIHVSPRYGKVSSRFLNLHRSSTYKRKLASKTNQETAGLYRQGAFKEALQWSSQPPSCFEDPVELVRKSFVACDRRTSQPVGYSRTRQDGLQAFTELVLELWGPQAYVDRLQRWYVFHEPRAEQGSLRRSVAKRPYPVFIPTKGRAREAHLNWSAPHCFGPAASLHASGPSQSSDAELQPLVIAVIEPSEADDYREAWPHHLFLILPEDDKGIAFSRWAIQKFCTAHQEWVAEDELLLGIRKLPFCWMCDDNLNCFYRLDDLPEEALRTRQRRVLARATGKKRQRISEGPMFAEAFLAVQEHVSSLSNTHFALCGFLRDDGTACSKSIDWSVDTMSIFKVVLLNLNELHRLQIEYISQLRMFEDVCLCAQVQTLGGKTLKSMRYCYRADNKNLGGCANTRAARSREDRATAIGDLVDVEAMNLLPPSAKTSLRYVCEWVERDENYCHRKAMLEDAKTRESKIVNNSATTEITAASAPPSASQDSPSASAPDSHVPLMKLVPKARGGDSQPPAGKPAAIGAGYTMQTLRRAAPKTCTTAGESERTPPSDPARSTGAAAVLAQAQPPGVVVRLAPVIKGSAALTSGVRPGKVAAGLPTMKAEPVATKTEPMKVDLVAGARVQCRGLKSVQYNGLYGVLQHFEDEIGRWLVRLDNGERHNFKPENLEASLEMPSQKKYLWTEVAAQTGKIIQIFGKIQAGDVVCPAHLLKLKEANIFQRGLENGFIRKVGFTQDSSSSSSTSSSSSSSSSEVEQLPKVQDVQDDVGCSADSASKGPSPEALAAAELLGEALKRGAAEPVEEPEFELVDPESELADMRPLIELVQRVEAAPMEEDFELVNPEAALADVASQIEALSQLEVSCANEEAASAKAQGTQPPLTAAAGYTVTHHSPKANANAAGNLREVRAVAAAEPQPKPKAMTAVKAPSKAKEAAQPKSEHPAPSPRAKGKAKEAGVKAPPKAKDGVQPKARNVERFKDGASVETDLAKCTPPPRGQAKALDPKASVVQKGVNTKARTKVLAEAKPKPTFKTQPESRPEPEENVNKRGKKRSLSGAEMPQDDDEEEYFQWLQKFWPEACQDSGSVRRNVQAPLPAASASVPSSPKLTNRKSPTTPLAQPQVPTPNQSRGAAVVTRSPAKGASAKPNMLEKWVDPVKAAPAKAQESSTSSSTWGSLRTTRCVVDLD